MREKEKELSRLLDEQGHLIIDQKMLLNRLKHEQVLSRAKIEKDIQELELDSQVAETDDMYTLTEDPRTKEEKNYVEEEQKWEE